MKLSILAIIMVLSFSSYSQEADSAFRRQTFVKLAFSSTEVTFPKLDEYVNDLFFFRVKEGRTFGAGGAGIGVGYSTRRFGILELGLSYFFADGVLSTRQSGSNYSETRYKLKAARLPVTLNYNLTARPRRIMFDVMGGAELLVADVDRKRTENSVSEERESQVVRPNLLLGASVNLKLSSRLKLIYQGMLVTNYATVNGVVNLGIRGRLN